MDRAMSHDEIAELLGAYALDAVEPDEAEVIDAHLAECPRCAAELAEHWEVTGLIANAGVDASVELWDHIAARHRRHGGEPQATGAASPGAARRHLPRGALAEAPALGVVGGGHHRRRRGGGRRAARRAGGAARPTGLAVDDAPAVTPACPSRSRRRCSIPGRARSTSPPTPAPPAGIHVARVGPARPCS